MVVNYNAIFPSPLTFLTLDMRLKSLERNQWAGTFSTLLFGAKSTLKKHHWQSPCLLCLKSRAYPWMNLLEVKPILKHFTQTLRKLVLRNPCQPVSCYCCKPFKVSSLSLFSSPFSTLEKKQLQVPHIWVYICKILYIFFWKLTSLIKRKEKHQQKGASTNHKQPRKAKERKQP